MIPFSKEQMTDAKNKHGYTPLMEAAKTGNTALAKRLIAAGANVNAKTEDGFTALIYAARFGNLDTVKALIVADADVEAWDNSGMSAVRHASMEGHTDIVPPLLNRQMATNPPLDTQTHALPLKYWKCPDCGAPHEKGLGHTFAGLGATVVGTVVCENCKFICSQQDINSGKYDTTDRGIGSHLRRVNSELNYFSGSHTAKWGSGHSVSFNDDWSAVELSWLLNGNLFMVDRVFTLASLRKIIEENFPAARMTVAESRGKVRREDSELTHGYSLTIHKFILSYAIRHDVSYNGAEALYYQVINNEV